MSKKINFAVEALKQPGNIVVLAVTGLIALVVGGTTGLVLAVIGAVGEGVYLALRSGSRGYRRKVLRRLGWGGEVRPKQLEELADGVTEAGAARYRVFRQQVNAVVELVESRGHEEDPLLAGVLANLQSMSLTYLKLLHADRELERLRATAKTEEVDGELAELDGKIAQADPALRPTLEQNRALLAKRRDRVQSAADKRRRLAAQLDLMDSTVKLLRDQAGDMSAPADISAQVDNTLANMNDARTLQGELDDLLLETAPPRVKQGGGS